MMAVHKMLGEYIAISISNDLVSQADALSPAPDLPSLESWISCEIPIHMTPLLLSSDVGSDGCRCCRQSHGKASTRTYASLCNIAQMLYDARTNACLWRVIMRQ